MKKAVLIIVMLFQAAVLLAQATDGPKNGPIITFAEKKHDFGDIKQGEKVEYVFNFNNTGTQPLIVSDVVTTCACTAKSWSKQPILPGQSGQVSVSFDSAGKQGIQNKVITVVSNAANSTEMLTIRVNVLPGN